MLAAARHMINRIGKHKVNVYPDFQVPPGIREYA